MFKFLNSLPWVTILVIGSVLAILWFGGSPLLAFSGLLGLAAMIGLFLFICWECAKNDVFFTFVKEGTGKNIMRSGDFHHSVISLRGYHLDKDHNVVKGVVDDKRPWFMKMLGLHWLGIIPGVYRVHTYDFQWNELEAASGGGERIRTRNTRDESGGGRPTDHFFVSDFTYAFKLEAAETEGNFPVDVITLATIAIENTYKPFFKGEDWLTRTGSAINGAGRRFVGHNNFDELRADGKEGSATEDNPGDPASKYVASVMSLNDYLEGENKAGEGEHGLIGRYGIRIKAFDIQDIALSGDAGNAMRDAQQEVALAKITKESTIIKSEGKQKELENIGLGQAAALEARLGVLVKAGSTGRLLAQLDAMSAEGPGKQIIWANNPFVSQIPGLGDTIEKSGLSPAELATILRKLSERKPADA